MDWLLEIFKFFALVLEIAVSSSAKEPAPHGLLHESVFVNPNFTVSRTASDTIFFTSGKIFKTGLYDTEYIGKVEINNRAPYLIYAGRDCRECDASLSLYINSADGAVADLSNEKKRYAFPGKVSHYQTGQLLIETRVFYGEVIGQKRGVIWYVSEYSESGDTTRSTHLLSLNDLEPNNSSWKGHAALIASEQLRNEGRCAEIPGREFTSEP
jgi:hypothetical protein